MLVKAIYEFNFEPDTSGIDDRFVDKKGISEEWAKEELKYMLSKGKITVEDFDFTVIDDGNDHSLPNDTPNDTIEVFVKTIFGSKKCILYIDKPILSVLDIIDKSWLEEMKKWYKFGILIWTDPKQKPTCISEEDKEITFANLGISSKCNIGVVEVMRNVFGRHLKSVSDETYTEDDKEED